MSSSYPIFEMQHDGSTHVTDCPSRFFDALTAVGAIYQARGNYWYLPRGHDNRRLLGLMHSAVHGSRKDMVLCADSAAECRRNLTDEQERTIRDWIDHVPVKKLQVIEK